MNTYLQIDENFDFLKNLWRQILEGIPKLLMAITFIIVAWLFIKLVKFVLRKILKATNIDSLATKLNEAEIFGKKHFNIVPSNVVLGVVKYLLILIFIIIASEILGLKAISQGISNFIAYLPILVSALGIFVLGVYVASIVKKAVAESIKSLEMSGSNLISNIVFYLIVVFVSITALNQAGINTEIITNNIIIILGAVLASFTIAFGLGARDIMQRLLFGFYSKRNFEIGQYIVTKDVKGTIKKIDNICITIKTEEGQVVMPIKQFVNQKVEVKETES